MNLNYLEKKIKINFKNKDLLIRSLTHKSFDSNNNNEKLEFLGDRILGFVIAKKLLELYPNDKEGILDKKLASLVNKKMCLQVCKLFEIEKFINYWTPKVDKVDVNHYNTWLGSQDEKNYDISWYFLFCFIM